MSTDTEKVETTEEETETSEEQTESVEETSDKAVEEPAEKPAEQSNINEAILQKLNSMEKNYKETIKTLKDKLVKTESELEKFKDEVKSKEPLKVVAEVKGKYDYSKVYSKMKIKSEEDYMQHCRSVFDKINTSFPSINKLN